MRTLSIQEMRLLFRRSSGGRCVQGQGRSEANAEEKMLGIETAPGPSPSVDDSMTEFAPQLFPLLSTVKANSHTQLRILVANPISVNRQIAGK